MGHSITDISPLATIASLRWVTLQWGLLHDISPLASLTNMTYLNLYANQITDMSPLLGAFPDNGIPGRVVQIQRNPATTPSPDPAAQAVIDELIARGVTVHY